MSKPTGYSGSAETLVEELAGAFDAWWEIRPEAQIGNPGFFIEWARMGYEAGARNAVALLVDKEGNLLREAAALFREYGRHHQAKSKGGIDSDSSYQETMMKAGQAHDIAKRIEDFLAAVQIEREQPLPVNERGERGDESWKTEYAAKAIFGFPRLAAVYDPDGIEYCRIQSPAALERAKTVADALSCVDRLEAGGKAEIPKPSAAQKVDDRIRADDREVERRAFMPFPRSSPTASDGNEGDHPAVRAVIAELLKPTSMLRSVLRGLGVQ